MKRFLLVFGLGAVFSTNLLAFERLYELWSLSPVHSELRHPSEGTEVAGSTLTVRSRFENHAVRHGLEPDRELYCRFLHSFLYGRHRTRSSGVKLLPQLVFDRYRQIDEIDFQFFSVIYRNQATTPYWSRQPSVPPETLDPEARLRVSWNRQETLVSYLQLKISRQEWETMASLLERRPLYSFADFYKDACSSVFQLLPQLRSNFQGLRNALSRDK